MTPLAGEVMVAPQAVPGSDGRNHLVYELRLSNVTPGEATLSRVEVLNSATMTPLLTWDHDTIATRLSIGGRRGAESAELGVGQFGVLFVHVAVDAKEPLPAGIIHRVTGNFKVTGGDVTMTLAPAPVISTPPVVIGPPLRGTNYVAADGCCDSIRHVRALLPMNGRFALAQRFAIDWEQTDDDARLVKGDLKDPASYRIFGREVHAVADGVVVSSRNDLPEQVPGALPPGLPIAEADGNFVVLDIGNGAFVLFAHMQPGSVTVKAGDRVTRGQVLGRVGNTGNSQAPHLHLHVMDGPSPLLSNGIPYVIDAFTLTAIDEAGTADFDRAEESGTPLTLRKVTPPRKLKNVLPLDLTMVDFP